MYIYLTPRPLWLKEKVCTVGCLPITIGYQPYSHRPVVLLRVICRHGHVTHEGGTSCEVAGQQALSQARMA